MLTSMLTLFAAATVTAAAGADPVLGLSVLPDGSYTVSLDGAVWLRSSAAAYVATYGGVARSSADGSLKLDGPPAPVSGSGYTGWAASFNGNAVAVRFALHTTGVLANAVVFTQSFPKGAAGADAVNKSTDLSNAFPSFAAPLDGSLAYNTIQETMCGGHTGVLTAAHVKDTGLDRNDGGTVLTLFNESGAAVTLAPYNDFMTAQVGFFDAVKGDLAAGHNGMLAALPAGHARDTILIARGTINATVMAFGDALLARGGGARGRRDLIVDTLGYWTDNGAYYYYLAEPGKNMQQTMLNVLAYETGALKLPFRHAMYDSWWYWKECGGSPTNNWLACKGAVELWEPRDDVFPDGFNFKLGLPLALHNRWWSAINNTYMRSLGFNASFIAEPAVDFAIPVQPDVFRYIMSRAQDWGMVLYEQDWLVTTYRSMRVTKADVTAASRWLAAMATAAESLGLTIQYCMPLPRHMLESTRFRGVVTNARASGDYHPGADNWDIGRTSLFYWALGVAPSKDDWWTTEVQPGSPYGDKPTEPNWQLQAITVALSTGPNGPSDMVGATNASLVLSTVRGDGLNVQPDKPATTLDSALTSVFTGGGAWVDVPRVTAAWTHHANHAYRWHNVLAVNLTAGFPLTAADLGPAGDATAYAVFDAFNVGAGPLAVLPVPGAGETYTIPVGQGQPSAPARALPIRYLHVVPRLPGGWWLLGDLTKLVPVSRARVADVFVSAATGFTATIHGSEGEPVGVVMSVVPPAGGAPLAVTCPSAAGVDVVLTCTTATGKCACA